MPFPRVWVQRQKQTVSSRIWTQVSDFIPVMLSTPHMCIYLRVEMKIAQVFTFGMS